MLAPFLITGIITAAIIILVIIKVWEPTKTSVTHQSCHSNSHLSNTSYYAEWVAELIDKLQVDV